MVAVLMVGHAMLSAWQSDAPFWAVFREEVLLGVALIIVMTMLFGGVALLRREGRRWIGAALLAVLAGCFGFAFRLAS